MTVTELLKDLRICASRSSCFGCTYYNSCKYGGSEVSRKNQSAMLENCADVIDAFLQILHAFDIEIENYYPYELNQASCSIIIDRIYDKCEQNKYESGWEE